MIDKNRPLYIFKYLLEHTDEEHPAIITDIIAHLEANGIHAARKTVASDLVQLQDCGFDVVCNKSRQNHSTNNDVGKKSSLLSHRCSWVKDSRKYTEPQMN